VEQPEAGPAVVRVRTSVVFSNWLKLKRVIVQLAEFRDVEVDLSGARLVDHTVMEKLHEMERDFEQLGRRLHVTGLDEHEAVSRHPHAARRKSRRRATATTLSRHKESEASDVLT
jgi:MFS superfamily sulfate permease-like transporter